MPASSAARRSTVLLRVVCIIAALWILSPQSHVFFAVPQAGNFARGESEFGSCQTRHRRAAAERHKFFGFIKSAVRPGESFYFDHLPFTANLLQIFEWLSSPRRVLSTLHALSNIEFDRDVEVRDARALEEEEGLSKSAFLQKHGFVLINQQTDWEWSDFLQAKSGKATDKGQYLAEMRHIVQNLAPDSNISEWGDGVQLIEGLGGALPHQDDVKAIPPGVLNLWRPIMQGPVRTGFLAICDPSSVDAADAVPMETTGLGSTSTFVNPNGLKFNQAQKWYHYPSMVKDEVLVFQASRVFHCTVNNPNVPESANARKVVIASMLVRSK